MKSLGDTIQVGAAELILRTTVPRQFTNAQHAFDYCNVVNYWFRTSDNPYQPRALYLMANFVNDSARCNGLSEPVMEQEIAPFDFSGRAASELLTELDEAILALDVPRTNGHRQRLSEIRRLPQILHGHGGRHRLQVPG